MIVRVFNHSEGIKIMVPVYEEALEKDTEKLFKNVPYFDCDSSEIPPMIAQDKSCLICHWKLDMINKKVIIKKTFDCVHDKAKVQEGVFDDPLSTRQQKLDAMLDLELLKRRGK